MITGSTCSSVIVRGAPGRGSSDRPSSRAARNRARHLPTVCRDTPSCAATALFGAAVRARQHDPRPQRQRLRRLAPPRPPLQNLPLLGAQHQRLQLRTRHAPQSTTDNESIGPRWRWRSVSRARPPTALRRRSPPSTITSVRMIRSFPLCPVCTPVTAPCTPTSSLSRPGPSALTFIRFSFRTLTSHTATSTSGTTGGSSSNCRRRQVGASDTLDGLRMPTANVNYVGEIDTTISMTASQWASIRYVQWTGAC